MDFAHIAPTAYLDFACGNQHTHLALAHLVLEDEKYCQWYRKQSEAGKTIIMDNSAFELYKRGEEYFDTDVLIHAANMVKADYVVMTDYPGEPWERTRDKAIEQAPLLHGAGFSTFYVPQGRPGHPEDLYDSVQWVIDDCRHSTNDFSNPALVDYIGISILAAPLAFNCEQGNKLGRFLARWKLFSYFESRGFTKYYWKPYIVGEIRPKIHMLGMTDGPNEIRLLQDYIPLIDSWDSSAAVWAGLNGIQFDDSPTGLVNGKFETPVDFNYDELSMDGINKVKYNIDFIDNQVKLYDKDYYEGE